MIFWRVVILGSINEIGTERIKLLQDPRIILAKTTKKVSCAIPVFTCVKTANATEGGDGSNKWQICSL